MSRRDQPDSSRDQPSPAAYQGGGRGRGVGGGRGGWGGEVGGPSSYSAPPHSSRTLMFAERPGYGEMGRKTLVRANHFLVEWADRDLHHYNVSITPNVTSMKERRDIIKQIVTLHREMREPAYDGRNGLYTAWPLPFESMMFVVELDNDSRTERRFEVEIEFASKVGPVATIQALNVVLRAAPSEIYTVVGRSFFAPELDKPGELGCGIDYWRGYYASLRPTQTGLSLNIDVSACPVYESILVIDFARKHCNNNFSGRLSDQDRLKIEKALIGIRVEVPYQKQKGIRVEVNPTRELVRRYTVTGVTTQTTSQLTFTEKNTEISVADYCCREYRIEINGDLPALQARSGHTNPTYLPMELCKIVAGQRYSKILNESQATNLSRATCQQPQDRKNSIENIVCKINLIGKSLVNTEFGIKVSEEHQMVEARVLPSPKLLYKVGFKNRDQTEQPKMGLWEMGKKKMYTAMKVQFWTCVDFSELGDGNFPSNFCDKLIKTCKGKGMDFNSAPLIPIRPAQGEPVETVLRKIRKESAEELKKIGKGGKWLELLIVILPDVSGSYGTIKRICETKLDIVSQCCRPMKAKNCGDRYLESLSFKINVKVGGRNTVLYESIHGNIPWTDPPTIIFGADVSHPLSRQDYSPSIAAVVASMDWPGVTKYRGIFSSQDSRQEIIQHLCEKTPRMGYQGMILEQFYAFYRSTGCMPQRVIFYRDGVGEGEFSQVLDREVNAIKKACEKFCVDNVPRLTFVIAVKRHHTRLFPVDDQKDQQSGNVLPGTVVDTHICHPTGFDFYLNSHAGIQGTNRPTHYHVLYDENNFGADSLQTLTNNLCYTHARYTQSVSIVPPAHYAHLLAFRARYYIEVEESATGSSEVRLCQTKDKVKDVMFYC